MPGDTMTMMVNDRQPVVGLHPAEVVEAGRDLLDTEAQRRRDTEQRADDGDRRRWRGRYFPSMRARPRSGSSSQRIDSGRPFR